MDDAAKDLAYKPGMNSVEMDIPDDDELDDDVPNFSDLSDDEAHDALCAFYENTLVVLYKIREEHPETMVDNMPIAEWVANYELSMEKLKRTNAEYEKCKRDLIEKRADMALHAEMFSQHFPFTFTSWVARQRPLSEFVDSYFDINDAQKYIRRNPLIPDHHHN